MRALCCCAMLCNIWNQLFESYERAALIRLQSSRIQGVHLTHRELDHLNYEIAEALRALRDHERQHHCHGSSSPPKRPQLSRTAALSSVLSFQLSVGATNSGPKIMARLSLPGSLL
jgi:hypothetical protein